MAPTTSNSLHRQLAHPYSRDSPRRSTRTRRTPPSLYRAADEPGTASTTATTPAPASGTRTKRSRNDKEDSTSNVEVSDKVPPRRSKRAKTSSLAVNKRKAEDDPGCTVFGDEEETTSAGPKTNKRARFSLVQTDSPHPAPARGAPAPDADEDDFSNFCRDETDNLIREPVSPAGPKPFVGSTSSVEAEVSTRRASKAPSKVQATPGSSSSATRSVKRKHEDEKESKTLDEDKHSSPSQAKPARSSPARPLNAALILNDEDEDDTQTTQWPSKRARLFPAKSGASATASSGSSPATPILDLTAEETEDEVDVCDDRSEEDGDRAAASPAPEVAAAPTHYFMTISANGAVNLDTDDQAAATHFDALRRDGRVHYGNALHFAQSYRDNMQRAPTAFQPAPAAPLAAGALANLLPDASAADRFAGLSAFGSFGAFDAFHSSHGAVGSGAGLPGGL